MSQYNVVIEIQPGSQSLAISCPCNDILYHGTRGSMKTATQLIKYRRYVGIGYGAFWRGIIFDTEYKNLDDLVAQSKKFFYKFNDGARFLESQGGYKWKWPTGEELLFRTGKKESDYSNFHGMEFPFIGFNELSKYPDSKFLDAMDSCMRSSFQPDVDSPDINKPLPPIPYIRLSTTNPFGVGKNWIKKRYIDPAPNGVVVYKTYDVEVPGTGEKKEIRLSQVAIFGSWKENKFIDPITIAKYNDIKDPNKRKAWLDGDWDITSGGRFDHLWESKVHVINPFNIPPGWIVDRSHDWGESKPFANLWFAESDGTEATLRNGKKWCPPAHTIILISEWYGCTDEDDNEGLKMSSINVAKGVKFVDGILTGKQVTKPTAFGGQLNAIASVCKMVHPGPADGSIFNRNPDNFCINDNFKKEGILWTESDKTPGSRINGAELICSRLEASISVTESGIPESPAFYVFSNCRGFISRFPSLPRDAKKPEDVDTDSVDHDYDAFRYRILAKRRQAATSGKTRGMT